MMTMMRKILSHTAVLLFVAVAGFSVSCCRQRIDPDGNEGYDKVMILYSAGFNNLSPYLAQNVEDLEKGYIPDKKDRNVLLVVSRRTRRNDPYNYKDETAPYLFRLYRQKEVVVRDTLWSLPVGTTLLDKDAMRGFLTKIQDLFPAEHYGMLFSSHSNGWLPSGYYSKPSAFDGRSGVRRLSGPIPAVIPDSEAPGFILTKSLGPESYKMSGNSTDTFSHEMEVADMAAAIPMHLDYLIFDTCLMGGVEVAYELKDVADQIGFSQAEVLAEGLNYRTVAGHLLQGTSDPESVCRDYYLQYDKQSGDMHSATVSLVDCSRLGELAEACKPLFEKYRSAIRALDKKQVQGFGGSRKPWYFDLEDMLRQAGATQEERASVEEALGRCVPYKAHTGQYYSMYEGPGNSSGTVKITAFCGLSMYLPGESAGSSYLDTFYKTLSWNKASGLVE